MRKTVPLLAFLVLTTLAGPAAPEQKPLADDGRVGSVTDLQGTALVRPVGRSRWSPVSARTLLMPGDQLRTMRRGAHAVEVRLAKGGRLVLGPGGLVEFPIGGGGKLVPGPGEALLIEPTFFGALEVFYDGTDRLPEEPGDEAVAIIDAILPPVEGVPEEFLGSMALTILAP